jgi:hypothetical protein
MIRALTLGLLLAVTSGCGGGGEAKVKGRLVENGQPLSIQGQASLVLVPKGTESRASYAVNVNEDGSFELVASGGSVPPGTYEVTLEVNASGSSPMARLKGKVIKVPMELKPGTNELTIDVAKPNG